MKRTILILLIAMCLMLMGVGQAVADPREKVNICHYDKDLGTWELFTVSGNAVDNHFAKHDDGIPGGVTSLTDTPLNNSCEGTLSSCGNCLTAHGGLGCDNASCEATVGALDPFCVEVSWDSICVDEAISDCAGIVCNP